MTKTLPFMSLRGTVLFPGTPMPVVIGRPFTIASIRKAVESHGSRMVICAQKAIEMNDRPDLAQVFSIGCECEILQMVEFPDRTMKVLVNPIARVRVRNLEDLEDLRRCEYEPLLEFHDYDFIMRAGRLLNAKVRRPKELTIEQMNEGLFEIDLLTPEEKQLINVDLARIQEVLEADDRDIAMRKLEALIS